jgi:hypothetical protein
MDSMIGYFDWDYLIINFNNKVMDIFKKPNEQHPFIVHYYIYLKNYSTLFSYKESIISVHYFDNFIIFLNHFLYYFNIIL